MKFKSALGTSFSGSVGGLTASHNRGGLYFRARRVPTNPASGQQQVVRNAVAVLTSRWGSTLTQVQRDAWQTYATNTPKVDRLGDSINLSGVNWYIACNTPRVQGSLAIVDAAPTTFGLATISPPEVDAFDDTNNQVDVGFTNTDAWANETGGALLIYASRPQNPGIEFFKGPYRLAGVIAGAVSPPTSPATLDLPFPIAVGQQVFFEARALRADGRVSSRVSFRGDVE